MFDRFLNTTLKGLLQKSFTKQTNSDWGDTPNTVLGIGLRKPSNKSIVFIKLFAVCISFTLKSNEKFTKINIKTATKNNHKESYKEYLLISL